MQYEWIVCSEDQGKTLQQFLHSKLEKNSFSLKKIKGFIDAGFCYVKGRPERFYRSLVTTNTNIKLSVPEKPVSKEVDILFEDEFIVVFNKPAGISCDERLVAEMKRLGKKILLVHRLDKDTTGLLITAKDESTRELLVEQFRQKEVHKEYLAICDRRMAQKRGTIENFLAPVGRSCGQVTWGQTAAGHFAKTNWRVLAEAKDASLVWLQPETGRTHQLRVHMSLLGHPILGDFQYGKKFYSSYPARRQFLHARTLSFPHPHSQEKITLQARLAADMKLALHKVFGELSCDF